MSEGEDGIWGYKSKRKKKASERIIEKTNSHDESHEGSSVQVKKKAAKKTSAARNTTRAKNNKLPGRNVRVTGPAKEQNKSSSGTGGEDSPKRTLKADGKKASPSTPTAKHSGHCPSCQMPFSILLVQTPRWHVSECLDTPSPAQTDCPDGLTCSSTIASHYKRYSHLLLAQSRAAELSPFPPISNGRDDAKHSQGAGSSPAFTNKTTNLKSSQACSPASSQGSVKQTSLDAWLSSPMKLSQNSLRLSQEIRSQKSANATTGLSQEDEDINDCLISYSPLVSDQELFSDDEDLQAGPVKKLFSNKSPTDTLDKAEERFAANERFITQSGIKSPTKCNGNNGASASKGEFVQSNGVARDCSTEGDYWSECSTPVSVISEWASAQQEAECWIQEEADDLLVGSANSYREAAPPRDPVAAVNVEKEFFSSTQKATQPFSANRAHARRSLTQIPSDMPSGSAAPSKGMKQMDIGVFFGMKPKTKPAEKADVKVPLKAQSLNAGASQVEEKWPRKDAGSLGGVESLTGNTGGLPATAPSGTQRRKRKAVGSLSDADSLINVTSGVTAPSGNQRWERKRFRQNSTAEENKGRKQCPFYKKIPGTGFAVDAFQYGAIEGCSAYFLTHFHSDHYGGLTKKFRYPIYCSKITGNLVASKLRVEKEFINTLPMDTECVVNNVKVVLLDANHCPGAVLLLFILPNGTTILHTGDFRADTSMERYPALIGRNIHTLYLDTTYCSPEYTFPPQQEAIQFAVNTAFEMMTLYPRTLVVCGTYSVGKEKVFLAVADVLGCKVCMSMDKHKTMQCLESDEIRALITTDWHSTALHVLPMMQVNFKGLGAHLNKFSGKYDRILAFKPTGWTYSNGCSSVADIRPEIRGKITIYGIPYSEHSSYLEMKRFVQFTRPQKIIPTVNVGNWKARSTMENYFAEWLSEARRK